MANLLRQVGLITYKLKRQYGLPVVVRWLVSDEYDPTAGTTVREYGTLNIRRAILFPDRSQLLSEYTGPFYQAGRAFTYGAAFDENTRPLIIDAKDLKGHVLSLKDEVIIRSEVYNIQRATFAEELAAYLCQISNMGSRENVGS